MKFALILVLFTISACALSQNKINQFSAECQEQGQTRVAKNQCLCRKVNEWYASNPMADGQQNHMAQCQKRLSLSKDVDDQKITDQQAMALEQDPTLYQCYVLGFKPGTSEFTNCGTQARLDTLQTQQIQVMQQQNRLANLVANQALIDRLTYPGAYRPNYNPTTTCNTSTYGNGFTTTCR